MVRLRKIHVTTGVFWVEAPEAGLYVLCGCPADVVKHLMRRGLIVQTECDGVVFETGPNAILLSDVMLQNGTFCNLAEFPVLQMFYRQGMILPQHPNNSGEKPLLIGMREQLDAQLQYIYRGNYGLVDRKELIDAGASDALADELLALKLKFAFGRIRHPKDLLDAIHLGDAVVHLKGGVTLRRLDLNYFEFRLGEETVTVDLNLRSDETYEPPYTLGAHCVDREYFAVIHSGEGDGWDPNRPSMGSVLTFQGRVYLVDAGPNVQYSLNALGIGINEIEGLFHTHCHDDHFAGLTTLLRADHRIKYYATPMVRASVIKKLTALMSVDERLFTECFDVRDLDYDTWNDIDGLQVKPLLSPHPVENSIFLFRALWDDGYRSYAHFADIVSLEVLGRMRAVDGQPGISAAFYDKVVADYSIRADIKKLDIGGGLIHGRADDFRHDESAKIILAHVSRPLSLAEKEIGSGAPFGTVDVIIPGNHHYVWRAAYESLRTYFPDTPHHELRVLLNSPLAVFNPETILVREGSTVSSVYLVITGTVEMIEEHSRIAGLLSAGSMVCEVAGVEGEPARETYRASSFVQALKISVNLYREFIRRNGLLTKVMALEERRTFLRSTWLCAESLTEMALKRLASNMPSRSYHAGEEVDPEGSLAFIKGGLAELLVGDEVIETLSPGDFFGEDVAVFNDHALFRVRAATPLAVYLTAAEVVRELPVMRWKLLETHERRTHAGLLTSGHRGLRQVRWRDEYSVNVQSIDAQHKGLIIHINALVNAVRQNHDREEVLAAMNRLLDYGRFHFREEEDLMERYGFPEIAEHRLGHRRLMAQALAVKRGYEERGRFSEMEIAARLREWAVGHILSDDWRFARMLNAQGVY